MTDKYLNNLINTLNKKQRKEHIFIRKLTSSVDLVKVYTKTPKMTKNNNYYNLFPSTFYGIKDDKNKYVAIVFDMENDLHWFVKREYRGNGYLTKALRSCILPYIFFKKKRDEQRITIEIQDNDINKEIFIASQKVAVKLGFILQNEKNEKYEYILKREDTSEIISTKGYNNELSEEELKNITNKIGFYAAKLIRLKTDLEMRYGLDNEILLDFEELIKEIGTCKNKIKYLE